MEIQSDIKLQASNVNLADKKYRELCIQFW